MMSGPVLAILAGLTFGIFQLMNRRGVQEMDVVRATFILLLVSAVILALGSVIFEDIALIATAPISALVYFALAGLIHFSVGWTLLSASQKRIGAARSGVLVGSTPFFATGIAAVFLGEILSLAAIAGITLVVAGVYMVSHE